MIGFYSYTVILTYISFASGVAGMFCAMTRHPQWAVFCLAFSGLCDMFDGKVARMKKDRTEDEKSFGIQIDSLCDVVCFGILPVIICFQSGMRNVFGIIILILYGLAGVIRLGYFNVMEAKRQAQTEEARKYYQGLPITSMAIALPILFVASPFLGKHVFGIAMYALVALVGILFVTDFKMPKPSVKQLFLLVGIVAVAVSIIVIVGRRLMMRF